MLPGEQLRKLHMALCHAFPKRSALEQMVRFGLDVRLSYITEGGDLSKAVYELIEGAEAQGRIDELIAAAGTANPTNPELHAFVTKPISPAETGTQDLTQSTCLACCAAHPATCACRPDFGTIASYEC
ncbi:MAG: effector-associated domain EAD1-containing protein [Chloroflexia bacterium]